MRNYILRRRRRHDRGQGLVEFALILPVLLLIVFGIIDFGRLMVIYAGASNGAREAVRYGAVPGRRADNSYNYMDCQIMRNLAKGSVPLMTLDDSDVTLTFDNGDPGQVVGTCGSVTAPQIVQGNRIVASVRARVALLTPILNNLFPTITVTFTAARTIVKDGVQTGPTQTPWPTRTSPPPSPTTAPTATDACNGHECTIMTETAVAATQTAAAGPTDTSTPPPPPTNTPTPGP